MLLVMDTVSNTVETRQWEHDDWLRFEAHLAIEKGLAQVEDDVTYKDVQQVVNNLQSEGILAPGKSKEAGKRIFNLLDTYYMSGGIIFSDNIHRLIDDLVDDGYLVRKDA